MDLEQDLFLDIAEAGMFLGLDSVVFDHLVDGQYDRPGVVMLFHQALYHRGVFILRSRFPSASNFWVHFDRLTMENIESLGADVLAQTKPETYNFETFSAASSGKVTPMVIAIAALAEAAGKPDYLLNIEKSLKLAYLAGQIYDDLVDWMIDLEQRHVTFVLSQLIPEDIFRSDTWPTIDAVQESLSETWKDIGIFDTVLHYTDKSLSAVNNIDCKYYVDYLEYFIGLTKRQQQSSMARHLRKSIEPLITEKT